MNRIRGGEHLRFVQAANDWIMADTDEGKGVVVSPTSVQFEPEEMAELLMDQYSGEFWELYEVHPWGDRVRKRTR